LLIFLKLLIDYTEKITSRGRREKIRKLKELIEKGEYDIPPEKVAEKILEFIKKNR